MLPAEGNIATSPFPCSSQTLRPPAKASCRTCMLANSCIWGTPPVFLRGPMPCILALAENGRLLKESLSLSASGRDSPSAVPIISSRLEPALRRPVRPNPDLSRRGRYSFSGGLGTLMYSALPLFCLSDGWVVGAGWCEDRGRSPKIWGSPGGALYGLEAPLSGPPSAARAV